MTQVFGTRRSKSFGLAAFLSRRTLSGFPPSTFGLRVEGLPAIVNAPTQDELDSEEGLSTSAVPEEESDRQGRIGIGRVDWSMDRGDRVEEGDRLGWID